MKKLPFPVVLMLALSVQVFVFGQLAHADIVLYEGYFSQDPGWTTNNSGNYYWNSSGENFYAKMVNINYGGYYAYRDTAYSGGSFRIEYDIYINNSEYASGLSLGLYDPDMDTINESFIEVTFIHDDNGHVTELECAGLNGYHASAIQVPIQWSLGKWYHVILEYNASLNTITATISGDVSYSLSLNNVGTFSAGMTRIGSSNVRQSTFQVPGNWTDGYFDNIVFSGEVVPNPDQYLENIQDCALSSGEECLIELGLCAATIYTSGGLAPEIITAKLMMLSESGCDASVKFQEGKNVEGMVSMALTAASFIAGYTNIVPCAGAILPCVETRIKSWMDECDDGDIFCIALGINPVEVGINALVYLASPARITIFNKLGEMLNIDENDIVSSEISESWIYKIDAKQLALLKNPSDGYKIVVTGKEEAGTGDFFDLAISYIMPNGNLLTLVYAGVATASGAEAMLILDNSSEDYLLQSDINGDHIVDETIRPTAIAYNRNFVPNADAGSNQTISVGPACMATVTLDGSGSSDGGGDQLTYSWTWDGGAASGIKPTIQLPLGTHTVTLVVGDGVFESAPDSVEISVIDATPPEIAFSVHPDTLWPPNHKMIPVTPIITATDNCDLNPVTALKSITMNEGEETNTYDPNYDSTLGDGHTSDDIMVDSLGNISLRAERSGTGNGRIYTLRYTATDTSGNVATGSATVTVPHNQ
jgi:hypothetical protein